ncbi:MULTISPECIES: cobaltochelatase subunit CobN [Cyanophyceae]|uniref:cobaltochelatase subunit CobN n=1 Tax=Cyanophyceae TaxID=3028117 RepID=UPI0016872B2A|nr:MULTISPECIES: cobaltochelatase subunit CobN [Cyanophyceae]MBD1917398.1 cobaltochelatase subunit CobN [Phormidium sp. FACHB-77]MBD2032357.1 cobaltochelatase subunit CobN [Phormidium sp. FACHB-322]MBD2052295.1 cobaltochelatase subunit CobN [Leptolyngbya sp. FACHB-60]
MHRLAATPGGWTPDTEGVIFVEQTPAPLVLLTAADTEIQSLTRASFPANFPALRVANLLQLQQQLAIDTYADDVLRHAQIIVVRLLGGRAYWPYGLEVVRDVATETGAALIVLPGDDRPAPDLISYSTVPLTVANQLWRYLNEGGVENMANGLMWVCDRILHTAYCPPTPQPIPKVGVYPLLTSIRQQEIHPEPLSPSPSPMGRGELENTTAKIGLIFYRAHYLAGNTAPIDALCAALVERHLHPVPVFVSSLQDPEVQEDLVALFNPKDGQGIAVLLNTTSFSVAKLDGATPNLDLWETLNVPVLQVILSGGTKAAWASQSLGLSPRDIAMNVALPEVDGRIITRAVSFKSVNRRSETLETDVVTYEPVSDRITFVADLAARWATLRRTPVGDRRIALILANYPNRDGRLANGVGLDTPQSAIEVLHALKAVGYTLGDIPADGDDLIRQLTAGVTNDPEGHDFRQVHQSLPLADYCQYFETIPEAVRAGMSARWGLPGGDGEAGEDGETREGIQNFSFGDATRTKLKTQNSKFPIPGIQLGNIFIGVQPSRGYDLDPSLNYHSPDLEPTHDYLAFYLWLRHTFGAQAIVHLGKHGNLEWLPGKGVGLSQDCYPEAMFGPMPHLYPFIVNDPGEGSQAKRRAQAVILDHLTPPLTRAELYGPLEKLEGLVDEYYEAQSLDPSRLALIGDRILTLLTETSLLTEISSPTSPSPLSSLPTLLPTLDTYLCDLKEAQIRDGLHIFGQCPDGRQLRDLVVAIARHPGRGRQGLTRAIAESWALDLDPLTVDLGEPFTPSSPHLFTCRIAGDVVEALEEEASRLVEGLLPKATVPNRPLPSPLPGGEGTGGSSSSPLPQGEGLGERETSLVAELHWIQHTLIPALTCTTDEIANLLKGLDGRYVPSGPAGAPTRNRPDVLPTGRNFFSVDIRAIPTESAWDVGRRAAEVLVEQYTQDHGDYPQTLGLSVWGTSTMRTGGDDIAEALALMGVRPVWDGPSRRVVDFEVLPLSAIGRPRVDVTLRISGFFRDAFPNLIDLVDQAVAAVAALEEPPEQNPLAARSRQESAEWQRQGLTAEQAELRSRYRIFGSKPGAYGAGLQGLIESQNWTSDEDLARAYLNWSGYAYGRDAQGHAMPEAFEQRLKHLQVVLHNQDNREHDLLDSDDYYQFQGGMTVAARTLQGQQPATYFGDNAVTAKPKVRSLDAEIAKVYRSRVVNPKWIEGVMRHGYKGAFEMAATVDYLFAYDATAHCVADHMYEGVAQAYLLDPAVQAFVQTSNPWALRDMAERLLEANQRGLWATAKAEMLDSLRQIANQAEGVLETQQFNRGQP